MNTNRQTFWNHPTAPAAHLGGVGRVHGDDLNTSTFSLVFKHLPEQSKPSIMRGQGKVVVSVHEAEGKVFNRNQVIFGNEPVTDLVKIIRSLIRNPLMQAGNLTVGFPLTLAALDLPRSVALQAAQPGKAFPQPAGVIDQLPSGESGKAFQAKVDANLLSSRRCAFVAGTGTSSIEANIPAPVDPLDDGVLDVRPSGRAR